MNSKFWLKAFYCYTLFNNINISTFQVPFGQILAMKVLANVLKEIMVVWIALIHQHSFLVLHETGTAMITKTKN